MRVHRYLNLHDGEGDSSARVRVHHYRNVHDSEGAGDGEGDSEGDGEGSYEDKLLVTIAMALPKHPPTVAVKK